MDCPAMIHLHGKFIYHRTLAPLALPLNGSRQKRGKVTMGVKGNGRRATAAPIYAVHADVPHPTRFANDGKTCSGWSWRAESGPPPATESLPCLGGSTPRVRFRGPSSPPTWPVVISSGWCGRPPREKRCSTDHVRPGDPGGLHGRVYNVFDIRLRQRAIGQGQPVGSAGVKPCAEQRSRPRDGIRRIPNVASPLAIGQIAALKITRCRGVSHVTLSPTCHPEGSRRV